MILDKTIFPTRDLSNAYIPLNEKYKLGGKMTISELDSKGRLTLPKKIRESLAMGKKVLIINAGDHLKIIPLPSDPFQTLHGAFNVKKPFEELRNQAELTAEKEAKKQRS